MRQHALDVWGRRIGGSAQVRGIAHGAVVRAFGQIGAGPK
ncbi:hypothetical protein HMPREF1503_0403 [Olsenella uli MSTE5]|nr:hypothetical protein HMPREF1503_0403 [Olsenella uli MSTE5]